MERWAVAVALTGWYLFALTGPYSTTLADLGLLLALVGSLMVARSFWNDVRREPVFWAILILLGYLAIHSAFFMNAHPEQAVHQNPRWSHWFRVGGLWALLLGWWLYRCPRHVAPLLGVLVAGLLVGIPLEVRLDRILDGQIWDRYNWGYHPNYLGMASGAAILVVLAWLGFQQRGRRPALEWGLALLILALLFFLLLASGARRAWLFLPLGLGALALFALLREGAGNNRARIGLGLLVGAGVLGGLLLLSQDLVAQRMGSQWETLRLVLSLDLQASAEAGGSVGSRIAMWLAGLQAIIAEPWFGWGAGAGVRVLQTDDFTDLVGHGHFHSLYMEIAVSFGLVGLLLFIAAIGLILRQSFRAIRAGVVSPALVAGLLATTVYMLVFLAVSVRIGQTEGRALITAFLAFHAYAMFRLNARERSA